MCRLIFLSPINILGILGLIWTLQLEIWLWSASEQGLIFCFHSCSATQSLLPSQRLWHPGILYLINWQSLRCAKASLWEFPKSEWHQSLPSRTECPVIQLNISDKNLYWKKCVREVRLNSKQHVFSQEPFFFKWQLLHVRSVTRIPLDIFTLKMWSRLLRTILIIFKMLVVVLW